MELDAEFTVLWSTSRLLVHDEWSHCYDIGRIITNTLFSQRLNHASRMSQRLIKQSRFKAIVTDQPCSDLSRYLLSSRARASCIHKHDPSGAAFEGGSSLHDLVGRTGDVGKPQTNSGLGLHPIRLPTGSPPRATPSEREVGFQPIPVTFNASSRRASVPIVYRRRASAWRLVSRDPG